MVLKEKYEATQKALSTAREAVTLLGSSVAELDACLAQSRESILEIDKNRDKLKAIKEEYIAKHGELVDVQRTLNTANAALAALKAKL